MKRHAIAMLALCIAGQAFATRGAFAAEPAEDSMSLSPREAARVMAIETRFAALGKRVAIFIPSLKAAALKGVPGAEHLIGFIAAGGLGMPSSCSESLKWYRKAAAQGYAPSFCGIARYYLSGDCEQENDGIAMQWYLLAAAQGNAEAQYQIGQMYFYSLGVPKDAGAAMQWWKRAGIQGHAKAQNNVGATYFDGDTGGPDYLHAYAWLNAALENGHEHSRAKRDLAEQKLSAADLEKARALSESILSFGPGPLFASNTDSGVH